MALVSAMLVLMAVTAAAFTAMTNTTIETQITGNNYASQTVLYQAECAAEVAYAALLSPLGSSNTLNDLLAWDADGDFQPDGNLTDAVSGNPSALSALGNVSDDINQLCGSGPGSALLSVQMVDDDLSSPFTDSNGEVFLDVFRTDPIRGTARELRLTVARLNLFDHGATVNLIDPNTEMRFGPLDPNVPYVIGGLSDGNGNTLIDGMVTHDGTAIPSGDPDGPNQVLPDGIQYDSSAKPTYQDIDNLKQLLLRNVTPIVPVSDGTVRIEGPADTRLGTPGNPRISYVQGNLEMVDSYGEGILFIEEYHDVHRDTMGLTLEGSTFHGLIIMLPVSPSPDFHNDDLAAGKVGITIGKHGTNGTESSLEGVLVAGSQSNGIVFKINDASQIGYNKGVAEQLLSKRFRIKSWSRREH
jgi:hypothetical protein